MENKDTDAKSQATSAPTAFLVDLVSNRKIPITTPRCRVGRDDLNDIVITGDQSISRFHFIINKEESQYSVQDAKSRHGTFLNGNQISGPEPINDGDVLKIGVSLFWFVIETPAAVEGDTPAKDEKKKKKIVLNPQEAGVPLNGATQDINQVEIIDKLTSLTEAAEAKSDVEEESKAEALKAEEEAREEAKKEEEAKELAAKEQAAKELAEKEEAEKEQAEKERAEKEQAEKEKAEKEEADKERAAKEEAEKEEEAQKAKAKKEQEETAAKPDKKGKKGNKEDKDEKSDKDEKPESSDDLLSVSEVKEEEKSQEDKNEDDEPEVSVKDLLGPLHDEIAASREQDKDEEDSKSESKDEIESEKESEAEAAKESEKDLEKEDEKEPEMAAEKESEDESDKEAESKTSDEPISVKEKSQEESQDEDAVLLEKSSQNDTLDRFADIIESSDSGKTDEESKSSQSDSHMEERVSSEISAHDSSHISSSTRNGAEEMTIQGPSTVPDWCKRYFADELKGLDKELDELNDQIRKYQDKIKDIEGQASLTKGIRNTLLVSEGDELIDACKKVLGLIGWKVTQSDEDKNELLLEGDDKKVTIARIIWTNTNAERSHLGQLSISQTRYWCEKGQEPKGVLIVSKVSDKAPTTLAEESDEDFTDFASKKNVCLMSTLQLLSLYRESALKNTKSDELREAIYESKGWLKGYKLEPGDAAAEEPAGKSLSSLLSS